MSTERCLDAMLDACLDANPRCFTLQIMVTHFTHLYYLYAKPQQNFTQALRSLYAASTQPLRSLDAEMPGLSGREPPY